MKIYLVDGTFELFRAYFAVPSSTSPAGREVGAARGVVRSLHAMIREQRVTHLAVAFDTVVESFRNEMFEGYKTGEGIDPELLDQFPLVEEGVRALGVVVWSMVEFEADDALASAVARYRRDRRARQIVLCSPDKDLAQCVRGKRVVSWDRIRDRWLDEDGVREKFGVSPVSIPDWLALVGDKADGIPGVPRWGKKAASTLLSEYRHLDAIPDDESEWSVSVRGAAGLARNLRERRRDACLYRELALLREDVPLAEEVDDLEWRGAREEEMRAFSEKVGDPGLFERVERWVK